jgi:hypothetical protein
MLTMLRAILPHHVGVGKRQPVDYISSKTTLGKQLTSRELASWLRCCSCMKATIIYVVHRGRLKATSPTVDRDSA